MKEISHINNKVTCSDPSFDMTQAPTYKKIIMDCLHMDRRGGDEAVRSTKLGRIINDQNGHLKLEDVDFEFLKNKIKKNAPGYPDFAIGDLLIKMGE